MTTAPAERTGVLVIRAWVERNIAAAGTTRIAYKDHVPIYRAIAAGDPATARAAMAAHMQAALGRLLAQDRRRDGGASR